MTSRRVQDGPAARWGRLVVLLVFAAGFFTMHGFLAVSASAGTHLGQQHGVATDVHADFEAGVPETAPHPVPDGPEPAEHHDLVAGCVVALVGVGLAGLALLLLRRSTAVEDLRGGPSTVVQHIRASASRWSPPRVALCVIRV